MSTPSQRFFVTAAVAVLVGLALLTVLAALNRRTQIVGLNEEIQYDDFAFSVLGVRRTSALGSGDTQTSARGFYYIVTLKIANHAKRVDYTFKKASALLVDDRGREFRTSDAQQTLESTQSSKCNDPIPAGASCTTEVAFDLPADSRPSQLRISEGGSLGDILDVVFYGRKRIELGVPQL